MNKKNSSVHIIYRRKSNITERRLKNPKLSENIYQKTYELVIQVIFNAMNVLTRLQQYPNFMQCRKFFTKDCKKFYHQRLQKIFHQRLQKAFLPKIPDILNSLTTNTTIIQKPVTGFAEQNFRFANFLCERNIVH